MAVQQQNLFQLNAQAIMDLFGNHTRIVPKTGKVTGAGVVFFGNYLDTKTNKKIPMAYLVDEHRAPGNFGDFGGTKETHHKNDIDVIKDEVFEESKTTIKISTTSTGELQIYNHTTKKYDNTNYGFFIDYTSNGAVYRLFFINVENLYGTPYGFSRSVFNKASQNIDQVLNNLGITDIKKRNAFKETKSTAHVPIENLYKLGQKNDTYDFDKNKIIIKGRMARVLPLAKKELETIFGAQFGGSDRYYHKYLKYKNKYLSLKNN